MGIDTIYEYLNEMQIQFLLDTIYNNISILYSIYLLNCFPTKRSILCYPLYQFWYVGLKLNLLFINYAYFKHSSKLRLKIKANKTKVTKG